MNIVRTPYTGVISYDLLDADRRSRLRLLAAIRKLNTPERRAEDALAAATDAKVAQRDMSYWRRRQWGNDNDVRRASCTFCKGTGEIATPVDDEYAVEPCWHCQWDNPWLPHDDGVPF